MLGLQLSVHYEVHKYGTDNLRKYTKSKNLAVLHYFKDRDTYSIATCPQTGHLKMHMMHHLSLKKNTELVLTL